MVSQLEAYGLSQHDICVSVKHDLCVFKGAIDSQIWGEVVCGVVSRDRGA